jgi:hypothetical protein
VRPLFLCLLPFLLHGISGPAVAQSRDMPEWVVPVLRLVSTTHVEPTTGVVLSSDGLVLVPAGFASPGDEIIVLDGGNDLIRNGRPARLERGFPELGLEVLQVEGLRRPPAPLAPGFPANGSSLRLRAFPPAEQIAEGAAPVNSLTTISVFPESETPALATETPLPNVTGPLLDECGNLAGLSMADGVQSLSASPATQYRWGSALRAVLAELRLPLAGSPCAAAPAVADEPLAPIADAEESPEILDDAPAPGAESIETDVAVSEASEDEPASPESVEFEPQIDLLPPYEEEAGEVEPTTEHAAETPPPVTWPWLLAALLMLTGGVLVYRLRRGDAGTLPGQDIDAPADPAVCTVAAEDSDQGLPAPALDGRLVLRGTLADGRTFQTEAAVSMSAINLEIGRGSADLVIDSGSVSRRHARLNGTSTALTLTDLGSRNGSTINGVPCLEGEIMFLEPADTVVLGSARFTVAIEDAKGRSE